MTQNIPVVKVALPVPIRHLFDYTTPPEYCKKIQPGMRVLVPFGKRELVGIIMAVNQPLEISAAKLKPFLELPDEKPLFQENLLAFFQKAAKYYHHPIGEVVFSGLPAEFKKIKKLKALPAIAAPNFEKSPFDFTDEQLAAITGIEAALNQFSPFLLQGVTGSGKTEVYLALTKSVLTQNQQVLVLVPEISLTPQTMQRFESRFGALVSGYHSQLTPAKRRDVFRQVQAGELKLIVGTRSALFLPFENLGMIIVDEEHDPSFKQQEGFKYSARDLSVLRAQLLNIPVILGSATPSFETLYNARCGKYQRFILPNRATQVALPKIELIDVRHKKLQAGLSAKLIDCVRQTLAKGGQVLLFINRRGYAPVYMCFDCGWFAECPHCENKLTYHLNKDKLICHSCDRVIFMPKHCPECQSESLNMLGQGTERVEDTLKHIFSEYTIQRVDSDTTRQSGSLDQILEDANQLKAQILIGTQILAKGHHFPHLSLVAVIDADGGLLSADFRAQERMAQLLIQVSGRAGRVHQAGKVLIQTFHPEHPFMQQILSQNYEILADQLLLQREKSNLPPYSHFALIRANDRLIEKADAFLKFAQQALKSQFTDNIIQVKGPIPSPFCKRQGRYHFQLLVQANDRQSLHKAMRFSTEILSSSKLGNNLRWSLDVDPTEMI